MTEHTESATIDTVRNLRAISKHMDDPQVDKALAMIVDAISKPDVPGNQVTVVITKLAALASLFATNASYYKGWGKLGTEERYKKDMYYTLKESLTQLADALKYQARMVQK